MTTYTLYAFKPTSGCTHYGEQETYASDSIFIRGLTFEQLAMHIAQLFTKKLEPSEDGYDCQWFEDGPDLEEETNDKLLALVEAQKAVIAAKERAVKEELIQRQVVRESEAVAKQVELQEKSDQEEFARLSKKYAPK